MNENLEKISFLNEQNNFNFYKAVTVTPTVSTKLVPETIEEKLLIFQRIFDVAEGWCYYFTENIPNATPNVADTNPNHTDQITDHQIVSIVTKALKG